MTDGDITAGSWIDGELSGSRFRDARLGARLRTLMAQMSGAVGAPIPLACQDWANTKAGAVKANGPPRRWAVWW